jgi:hypothetical protein
MNLPKFIFLSAAIFLILPIASAAHYIVGEAYNATDGTSANGRIITLWRTAYGATDNITDIVGSSGNSGTDNVYFVDCEMLASPCEIGDNISATIFDNGDSYSSNQVSLIVTGAGFDIMPNVTIKTEMSFANVNVDDAISYPQNEIDLIPADTVKVSCSGIVQGTGMDDSINNVTSEFFSIALSFYGDSNQNNKHYTNSSCFLNISYGNNGQVFFNCTYNLEYYAVSGNWSCVVKATKNETTSKTTSASTAINTLLALEMPDFINYSLVTTSSVSEEQIANVTNYGNVAINLSLQGYAYYPGDNVSMNCSAGAGKNISVTYEKYNLTASTPGTINLQTFENNYINLTSSAIIREFSLNARQSDIVNDAVKSTYWRIYVPSGVGGVCSGKIIAGAANAAGI